MGSCRWFVRSLLVRICGYCWWGYAVVAAEFVRLLLLNRAVVANEFVRVLLMGLLCGC